MVLATAAAETEELVQSYMFASRYIDNPLPRFRLPESSIPKDAAYQIIQDEILLDWNPKMNLSTFVTTWMEPECDKLMMSAINKNYLDLDGCPVTKELQNRCVNMLARLFHAPLVDNEQAAGVATVGSSEAIMLAGLAYKRRWQNKRKTEKKPYDDPNIVIGSNMQVCWRKFATYFEVELKEIPLEMGMYTMNPDKVKEMVDENTICVCTVLGSTYNGEYEDVEAINDILTEINQERGLDIPIHVDAASGGFVAPFLDPDYKWDFRLPQVRSINVSGHKYGLVYAGVGWMIWRSKRDIPEELIFNIECTGPGEPTYSLNFSRGSSQLIGQYYQLIRLGFEGYKKIMDKCRTNAKYLTVLLEKSGRFNIISCPMFGVPLVAFSLKDSSEYDEHDVSDFLCMFGWIVPVYTMPPNVGDIQILRVVVREDFSRTLAERLAQDIEHACKELGYDFYSCADQEGEEGSHQEVDEEEAGGHDEAADGQGHESTTEVDGEGGETGESGGQESDESGDYEENQPTNAPC